MADVDLTVAVSSAGVERAIAQLDSLKKSGLNTATALGVLADRTRRAAAETATAFSGNSLSAPFKQADRAVNVLTASLQAQQAEYRRLSSLAVGATAAERLTNFGGGSLLRGTRRASAFAAEQEALNADPIRDQMVVEQQRAALSEAHSRATAAQGQVAVARWERELAAMTPVEAASARLTRATQELAVATRMVNVANDRVSKNRTAANYDYQTQAMTRQAAAVRGLTSAQQGLVSVQESEQRTRERDLSGSNAFQSSYSYFIIAGLATGAAVAIRDMGGAALTASAQIERSFADVRRTTEGTSQQVQSLRDRLFELSTTRPTSFIDLAQIATLGNQLGVAAEDVESFTTTMSEYTAVSGQSAEDAATAFGRISNLTGLDADKYSNLASAITFVARTSVATEATIQNTAKEITALASGAGFSADSIVGLAGALSSLAIPPERARGALSLYFGALNSAVAEGGPKMEAFATLTNKTAAELEKLVRENRGQEVFTSFISGLSQLDTVAKTSALDELGLSTIRVDQTMRALSQNVPLLTQSFEGANRAFTENVEIGKQYAIIQDTLDSQWKMFQSAVMNAAAAMGDEFAPAAKDLLAVLNHLLVGLAAFADTPIGQAMVQLIGLAAVFTAGLAAIVGVAALAKASLVVLSFAVEGFGWTPATVGLRGWVASLAGVAPAAAAGARSTVTFGTALRETTAGMSVATVGTRALSGALTLLKVAFPIIAITAAIALYDQLATSLDEAINPSKRLTGDLSGLKDALIADNPNIFNRSMEALSKSADGTHAPVSAFNAAILSAIEIQKRAEGQIKGTTDAINSQAFSLGPASRKWIADALPTQKDIADILDGHDFGEGIGEAFDRAFGGSGSADEFVSRDNLQKMIEGGFDLNTIAQISIKEGKEAANKAYLNWAMGFDKAHPELNNIGLTFANHVLPGVLDSVGDSYTKTSTAAALSGTSIEGSGVIAAATADQFDSLGKYVGDAVTSGQAVTATFIGVKSSLSDLQDNLQGAMGKFIDFDSVFKSVQDEAKQAAEDSKNDSLADSLVNVDTFTAKLNESSGKAVAFYEGIKKLADGGRTSFATQLAGLGPDAQGILAQSLDLSPEAQGRLEAAARFAAFLASDAFKKTLQASAVDANEAYARIFRETGNLSDVQALIAAQIAGPEAVAVYEKEWDVNHPNFPLNITPELKDPSAEDVAVWGNQLSDRLTVTPKITFDVNNRPRGGVNTYTDSLTGASIELPASLDGKALSASLAVWQADQTATPEQIASKLNTDGFNADIDAWIRLHGPISIQARVVPQLGADKNGRPLNRGLFSRGGEVEPPRFADGGSWGQFSGPGTGTSDSIWARVSANEYISTADATNFWGPDFFDSLNRKMLPTSFLNLLGAAAVSGNHGPSHVAHVSLVQNNPLTRDPLKKLREDSEMLAEGIWG